MDNEILIVCLTDLTDSVKSTRDLGHQAFLPQVDLFRDTAKAFVELTHGKAIKGKGDGDIIVFRSPDQAVRFAALLQSYYKQKPALHTMPNEVRISIFSGEARVGATDIDGSAINLASRLENIADPGQVIMNETLMKSLKSPWGPEKFERLIRSIGKHPVRGGDPPEQELYQLDWSQFCLDSPDDSLSGLIWNHLSTANVDKQNLGVSDLSKPGIVIWPAVPRDVVTAIHRGQTEIIRLLALLGWQVHLLIEDCAGTGEYAREYSDNFQAKLERYLSRRDLSLNSISRLSDYYKTTHDDYEEIQELFKEVTSKLSFQQMERINNKHYDPTEVLLRRSTTLKFLSPALSIAVVIHLAQARDQKVIIVSGEDERNQWRGSYNISNARAIIGAIMIPILKQDPEHQAFQSSSWPIWDSEGELIDAMTSAKPTNLAWWVFNLHAFIPAFPHTRVEIGGKRFDPTAWPNREQILPDAIQASDLARKVWELLDPAA
jgi:hypothetical protein